jgi:NAD-dependent dihydropyrimidine dehydrogenase PreA subunit
MKRQIITIDEKRCTGCGDCIPTCPEGALQIIDGKARLVSDLFCDGLGACLGKCPTGAMSIESREAEPYDERRVMMESIVNGGPNVIEAHLEHLAAHGEHTFLQQALECLDDLGLPNPLEGSAELTPPDARPVSMAHAHNGGGCPGSRVMAFNGNGSGEAPVHMQQGPTSSELRQWPVQLHLVTPLAPYFHGSDLLLAADCTAFAVGDFHSRFMRAKSLAIACPKLDAGMERYIEKLTALIDMAKINTITVAIMEVPCCGGLMGLVERALEKAERRVPVKRIVVSVTGETLSEEWIS